MAFGSVNIANNAGLVSIADLREVQAVANDALSLSTETADRLRLNNIRVGNFITKNAAGKLADSGISAENLNDMLDFTGSTLNVDISGNAATADALTTSNVGDVNNPVYFNDGIPVVCNRIAYFDNDNKLVFPDGTKFYFSESINNDGLSVVPGNNLTFINGIQFYIVGENTPNVDVPNNYIQLNDGTAIGIGEVATDPLIIGSNIFTFANSSQMWIEEVEIPIIPDPPPPPTASDFIVAGNRLKFSDSSIIYVDSDNTPINSTISYDGISFKNGNSVYTTTNNNLFAIDTNYLKYSDGSRIWIGPLLPEEEDPEPVPVEPEPEPEEPEDTEPANFTENGIIFSSGAELYVGETAPLSSQTINNDGIEFANANQIMIDGDTTTNPLVLDTDYIKYPDGSKISIE